MIMQVRILSYKRTMTQLVEINYKVAVAIVVLIIYLNGCVTNKNMKLTVTIDCIDSYTEITFSSHDRNCLVSI